MARRRCVECVYYLKRSRYCILLGRRVEDPEHPPCLKQREEKAEKPHVKMKTASRLIKFCPMCGAPAQPA